MGHFCDLMAIYCVTHSGTVSHMNCPLVIGPLDYSDPRGRDVPQRQRVSTATAVLTERERPLHPFPLQLPLGAVAAAVN